MIEEEEFSENSYPKKVLEEEDFVSEEDIPVRLAKQTLGSFGNVETDN